MRKEDSTPHLQKVYLEPGQLPIAISHLHHGIRSVVAAVVQRDAQPRTETGEDREAETAPSFLIGIEFEAMGRVLDWVSE